MPVKAGLGLAIASLWSSVPRLADRASPFATFPAITVTCEQTGLRLARFRESTRLSCPNHTLLSRAKHCHARRDDATCHTHFFDGGDSEIFAVLCVLSAWDVTGSWIECMRSSGGEDNRGESECESVEKQGQDARSSFDGRGRSTAGIRGRAD